MLRRACQLLYEPLQFEFLGYRGHLFSLRLVSGLLLAALHFFLPFHLLDFVDVLLVALLGFAEGQVQFLVLLLLLLQRRHRLHELGPKKLDRLVLYLHLIMVVAAHSKAEHANIVIQELLSKYVQALAKHQDVAILLLPNRLVIVVQDLAQLLQLEVGHTSLY